MTVSKDKNGNWGVDVSDGFSPLNGAQKRHRKIGFKTKKEALDYEAQYRLISLQQVKIRDKISVGHLYSLLKEEDELRGNSQATKDTQKSYYKQYVSKFFSKADMKKIEVEEVKQFRDWLSEQPSVKGGKLSATTVNQQMIFVHKLFDIATLKGFRKDNPSQALKRLSQKQKEMSYYTPEQFKRFIKLIDEEEEFKFQLLYKILMFTGARMGEALAFTWKEVSFSGGYIDVKQAAHYRKKKVTVGETKTAQSVRRIYIHKGFINELQKWKNRQFDLLSKFTDNPETLQIYQTEPEILTHPQVSGFRHDKLKKRMPSDMELIRNHDFRHSHAAFLINQGLRNGEGKDYIFFTLMKRLGHTSITTTINTYSHLFPTQQKEVANAFDDF